MIKFKEYPIYKKRDGQDWKLTSGIYETSWINAKKCFANMMTNDNWSKSNNIVWLDKSEGVKETGWYDLDRSWFGFTHPDNGDETEGDPDYKNATHMELFCSEKSIKKGFDYWNEDVYTWELRKK